MSGAENVLVLINQYLAGELEGEALQAFEERLANEPELNKEVQMQRALQKTVSDEQVMNFARSLHGMRAEYSEAEPNPSAEKAQPSFFMRNRWIFAAAASLALIAVVSWWIFAGRVDEPTAVTWTTLASGETRILEDGSHIELSPNSELSYLQPFPTSLRELALSGTAQFTVEHDSKRPFQVKTGNTLTTVLGTVFTISSSADQGIVQVEVESGTVSFAPIGSTEKVLLTAGETGRWEDAGQNLEKTNNSTSKTFNQVPVNEAIAYLESIYNLPISIANPEAQNCPFSGLITGESLNADLETVSFVTGLEVTGNDAEGYTLQGSCH